MAMESQLTLVTVDSAVRLTFNRDNATISLDSVHAYTITTDAQNMYTELRAVGNGELLVRIVRKAILPDTIAFPTTPQRLVRYTSSQCFSSSPRYRHGTWAVHSQGTPSASAGAKTTYSRWLRVGNASTPTLVICAEPWASSRARAQVIAAFIVQEFKMRMKEQASLAASK
ncbi:hypothetical protein B0H14DRAFT_3471555 [Mycena olivaceomarginata]|nr:hypothetical protein B0H14DRAFT_3471555 [Mycena olivaceomarginata]